MDHLRLAKEAVAARKQAYAPYSGFKVGAALLTVEGKVYRGCNVENVAYSPSTCAERTAFCSAVAGGFRDFTAIAVAGWNGGSDSGAFPCGVCRQIMAEFCDPQSFRVIVVAPDGSTATHTLADLLPHSFSPPNVRKPREE